MCKKKKVGMSLYSPFSKIMMSCNAHTPGLQPSKPLGLGSVNSTVHRYCELGLKNCQKVVTYTYNIHAVITLVYMSF